MLAPSLPSQLRTGHPSTLLSNNTHTDGMALRQWGRVSCTWKCCQNASSAANRIYLLSSLDKASGRCKDDIPLGKYCQEQQLFFSLPISWSCCFQTMIKCFTFVLQQKYLHSYIFSHTHSQRHFHSCLFSRNQGIIAI